MRKERKEVSIASLKTPELNTRIHPEKQITEIRRSLQKWGQIKNAQRMIQVLVKYGPIIEKRTFKLIYDCLVGGDPKRRTMRAIITTINMHYSHANNGRKNP